MGRKAVGEGKKYDMILNAAKTCFFNNGFEGTSIRDIMKTAGSEVGLFYYYFDSKEEVYSVVLDKFFEDFRIQANSLIESGLRDPFRLLSKFIFFIMNSVNEFRQTYADTINESVRFVIRERATNEIEPFMEKILLILESYGALTPMSPKTTAIFLSHGIGSMIVHEDSENTNNMLPEIRMGINLLMGIDSKYGSLIYPDYLKESDIDDVIRITQESEENYVGLKQDAFKKMLQQKVKSKESFVIRLNDRCVAIICFSYENKEIEFISVSNEFQHKNLGARLLLTTLGQFPLGTTVCSTTIKPDDNNETPVRKLFKKFDFIDSEEFNVFGNPCVRMTTSVKTYSNRIQIEKE